MTRRRSKGPKVKKAKKVSYELVRPEEPMGTLVYDMLGALVKKHHPDLTNARIVLAWNTSWKPDVDGRLKLGMCRKASDLDRELVKVDRKKDTVQIDFVIVLNKRFWEDPSVSDTQRRGLLDHQCCHAGLSHDKNQEPIEDERGRKVYRLIKHDVEEFSAVIARHGTYQIDLEKFAAALWRSKQKGPRLFDKDEPEQPPARKPPESAEGDAAASR